MSNPAASIIATTADGPIAVAITGASGGFGRTFLAQLKRLDTMRASVLVDLDLGAASALLSDLGYPDDSWSVCGDASAVSTAVAAGRIALVDDIELLDPEAYDVLVEATGSTRAGFTFAERAIDQGRHVVMVSKEVESLSGVYLADRAKHAGVAYLPGMGDQPANLLSLLDWVSAVGLPVVAVGKSSEYDLVFDPSTGVVRQLHEELHAPEVAELLTLGDDRIETLDARTTAVSGFKRAAAADYCEMAVVSQYSGHLPDVETLHYPVARPDELADIYALREHGGLLNAPGAADVFSMLRLPGEASFAGGEFVIVETGDTATWQMLREKGHVVSRDGRYACIFSPYHLMGVETPRSVLEAVSEHHVPAEPRQFSTLVGRAEHDLPIGTELRVAGHHHEIDGVAPVLRATVDTAPDVAPFYLLDRATLARPVVAGELITVQDIDGFDPRLWDAFAVGRELGA
ncbi:Predicted homoserine dehydrogenase, contains C-terminal SAF domain [Plantibacter flavus]|uniref:Putative homoserine dehydrogenase-like protein n=1 Tax=Plantibacter flavus TaxID=150123 RepID=A0A3N2C2G3_9MICO|nr:homoserine dehydrogenase [Plantibacter flavus]ROR81711.1 putative homoserine dehydrogenase-like protein [Plantibacter flavus]SMG15857.1 Predicted homoserine dehydrogenase, contains C-terminal SAF domain [Plantibacter flavus]